MTRYGAPLAAERTPIPGLLIVDLPVHGDARGWFKENWQREKLAKLGVPDFGPVQNNVSFNDAAGTTRGIHAEPWDKWVSVATGRIFGAWVDLRAGETFGTVVTAEIDPSRAVFVPRGVGNAFQTLEPGTAYNYLVNDHWSPDAAYSFLNLADETVAIDWPIALSDAEISAKDHDHPRLSDVEPLAPRRTLVIGANGQLGRALRKRLGDAAHIEYADRADLDLAAADLQTARRWRDYGVIVNAAAYTAVDSAETAEGRARAWSTNVSGLAALVRVASQYGLTLVHVSSDYVFDGAASEPYTEDAPFSPLSVYGQTKAAGDAIVGTLPHHFIVRTSWVVGDGPNFVRTMMDLAHRDVAPRVVSDQRGRLTFSDDLADAIAHLITTDAHPGTYNVTGDGPVLSWAEVARRVFELCGHDPARVTEVSTEEYFAAGSSAVAPRPQYSVLDLGRISATGWVARNALASLEDYVLSAETSD